MRACLYLVLPAVASLLACDDGASAVDVRQDGGASTSTATSTATSTGTSNGAAPSPGAALTAATPAPPPPREVDLTTESTTFGGVARSYILATPHDYDPARSYPLVMAFHGNPGTKEAMRALAPIETVSHKDAFIVYPDAMGGAWDLYTPTDSNNDMNFVKALVGVIGAKANIDPSRVYGFGFSGGSFFITQMACRFGGFFRAIAVSSGGGPNEAQMGYAQRADQCYVCPGGPIATLVVHGDKDTQVSDASGAFVARCFAETNGCQLTVAESTPSPCVVNNGCPTGKPVKWCHIDGLGHAPWAHALDEAWSFFNAAL